MYAVETPANKVQPGDVVMHPEVDGEGRSYVEASMVAEVRRQYSGQVYCLALDDDDTELRPHKKTTYWVAPLELEDASPAQLQRGDVILCSPALQVTVRAIIVYVVHNVFYDTTTAFLQYIGYVPKVVERSWIEWYASSDVVRRQVDKTRHVFDSNERTWKTIEIQLLPHQRPDEPHTPELMCQPIQV